MTKIGRTGRAGRKRGRLGGRKDFSFGLPGARDRIGNTTVRSAFAWWACYRNRTKRIITNDHIIASIPNRTHPAARVVGRKMEICSRFGQSAIPAPAENVTNRRHTNLRSKSGQAIIANGVSSEMKVMTFSSGVTGIFIGVLFYSPAVRPAVLLDRRLQQSDCRF